ncbi:MAG: outer membrane lipoprotein carrier protein LolA [Thermodesulfovibrionales bacterium]
MRGRNGRSCLIGTLCSLVMAFALFPCLSSSADPAVEKIQKAYQGIRDLKGSFVQKSHLKDLDRTDTFKGKFMIKLPAKMRWQYHGTDSQDTEVIIANDEIIIYQKKDKQAFRGKFDRDTYGQAPIALLGGFGNIEKEFDITNKDGRLLLKPKKPMGAVVSIEITPSGGNFPIGSLTITDRLSNRIDITLSDITLNTGMADAAFEFSLPMGVSMYELNGTR